MAEPLLEVKDLKVSFRTEDGLVRAVDGISFTVDEGEVVGIVGESGSGKSVTMMSVMRLITDPNVIYEGEIVYKGRNLMGLSQDAMREVRGEEIAMIFQDPMTSLNPVYTVGWQIEEQLNEHYDLKKGQARRRASELLAQVGIPRPEQRIDDYPHQFSGGMRQRVMIALALSCNPDLLIADEPTTALDVTIQAQILELIKDLRRDFGSAVVLITHDLGVVAEHVFKYFPIKRGILIQRTVAQVHAVNDVSLEVRRGETLGLVGESGCGKSTLGRCFVRLFPLTDGRIVFDGQDISKLSRRGMRPLRRELQIVFQDPYASLNPRKRVGSIVGAPLAIHGIGDRRERKRQVQELLEKVGLSPEHYNRFPHEFSGGQRQPIRVARAPALRPKLVIADEPVSALDVSIQAQVINLLADLQEDFELTYVFIAHDLGVVRHVSDRIAVMYLGKIVELSPAEELYERPIMPYTEALLSAVPIPDPRASAGRERIVLEGDVPSPINPPSGCRFHPRCRYATDVCRQIEPPLVDYGNGHLAACHHPLNVDKETLARASVDERRTPEAADESAKPSEPATN